MEQYGTRMTPGSVPDVMALSPKKPINMPTWNQYKAMFRRLYKFQLAQRVIGSFWDQIWTTTFDNLQNHVKRRTPMIKKSNYEEKVSRA